MRGFAGGLFLGLILGAGGVYAALEKPWESGGEAAVEQADAGAEVAEKKPKNERRGKKRRRTKPADDGPVELTAADKELVTKGDAVELPPKELDMGEGGGGGRALSGTEINDTIRRSSQPMIDCINDAAKNAPLKSKVTLKLLVNGEGRVVKTRVTAPRYLFEQGFYPCARSASRRLVFPATGAHTVVTAPYDIY